MSQVFPFLALILAVRERKAKREKVGLQLKLDRRVDCYKSDASAKMAKKLYVGNLSYSTTEEMLKEAFSKAGTVDTAMIITDKMSGRSKGFGFVEMSSDEEAQKAIEMWDGKEIDGRSVKVNEARPMTERPPRQSYDR